MARRWTTLAAMAGVGGLLFAACSSSPSPSSSSTTTTSHRGSATSSTTTSTTAAPVTTTSTTAAAVAGTCTSIKAASGQGEGAAGTITGTIVVTNTGSAACTVNGYPTLALYSGSQAPLTVTIVNGLTVSVSPLANAAPTTVTLAASGGTAQFSLQYSDVPTGSETSCPQSELAAVTLPGGGVSSSSFAFSAAPCNNGMVYVSPLYVSTPVQPTR